jgi:hypothetical protein
MPRTSAARLRPNWKDLAGGALGGLMADTQCCATGSDGLSGKRVGK